MRSLSRSSHCFIAGCWVGPTVLFASQYAEKIYALEPDPAAHREAYHNIHLNPAKAAKIDLRRLCISDKPGQLTLYGSPGDSMSSSFPDRNGGANRKDYQSWNVECTTLDTFIESEGINTDDIALIKVDTEGHESPIMWQLKDWFKAHPKITVALSVHAFQYPDLNNPKHAELQERLRQVIVSFKHVILTHNGEVVDKNAFSVGGYCYLCGLILTNQDPSELGVSSWKEAFTPKP
jgi:FkbM family methyltransferase